MNKNDDIEAKRAKMKHDFQAIEYENEYLVDLNCHLDNGCRNIGLLGGYASGKSSIIKSLEKKYPKEVFVLSASDFSTCEDVDRDKKNKQDIAQDSPTGNDAETSKNINIIEGEQSKENKTLEAFSMLIHQLHMLINPKNHINSELILKRKMSKLTLALHAFAWGFLLVFVIHKFIFSSYINLTSIDFVAKWIKCFIIIELILLCFSCALILYSIISNKYTKIAYNGIEIDIQNSLSEKDYLMSELQILVELFSELYYENTCKPYHKLTRNRKKIIVVLEDIDRYREESILTWLHKVSSILNVKKDVDIRFIYSVDPSFVPNDAPKFFDAIVDIIPFYDKYNAAVKLNELITEKASKDAIISSVYANTVALYCSDIRVLKRVINLYLSLSVDNQNISNEEVFSISLLKILYPNYLHMKPVDDVDNLEMILELIFNNGERQFIEEFESLIDKEDLDKDSNLYSAISEIKNDRVLTNLLKKLLSSSYLKPTYKWILSKSKDSYNLRDEFFITNYSNDNLIPLYEDFDIHSCDLFFNDYVNYLYLKNSKSLLSANILTYIITNLHEEGFDNYLNAYIINLTTHFRPEACDLLSFKNLPEGIILDQKVLIDLANVYVNTVFDANQNYKLVNYELLDIIVKQLYYQIDDDKFIIPNRGLISRYLKVLCVTNCGSTVEDIVVLELVRKLEYEVENISSLNDFLKEEIYKTGNYKLNAANLASIEANNEEANVLLFEKWCQSNTIFNKTNANKKLYLKFINYLIEQNNPILEMVYDQVDNNIRLYGKRELELFRDDIICDIYKSGNVKYDLETSLYTIKERKIKNIFDNFLILEHLKLLDVIAADNKEQIKAINATYFNSMQTFSPVALEALSLIQKYSLAYYSRLSSLNISPKKIELVKILDSSIEMINQIVTDEPYILDAYLNENEKNIDLLKELNHDNLMNILAIDNLEDIIIDTIIKIIYKKKGTESISIPEKLTPNIVNLIMNNGILISHDSLKKYIMNQEFAPELESIINKYMSYGYTPDNYNGVNYIVRSGVDDFSSETIAYILMHAKNIEGYTKKELCRDIQTHWIGIKKYIYEIMKYHMELIPNIDLVIQGKSKYKKLKEELELFDEKVFNDKFINAIAKQAELKVTENQYVTKLK